MAGRTNLEISARPQVSIRPHRFGGRKFRFGTRKRGTCTLARSLTCPFPAQSAMRGWSKVWLTSTIGFPSQVGSLSVLGTRMISTMPSGSCRLSPLGYALKTASDSRGLLQQQSEGLHLNHRFTSLFEPFVPKTANRTVPGVAVREHHDPFVCNLWNSISSR